MSLCRCNARTYVARLAGVSERDRSPPDRIPLPPTDQSGTGRDKEPFTTPEYEVLLRVQESASGNSGEVINSNNISKKYLLMG